MAKLAEVTAHQVIATMASFTFFTCQPQFASKAARESGMAAAIDLFIGVVLIGALAVAFGVFASWARDVLEERKVKTDGAALCLRIIATLDGGSK